MEKRGGAVLERVYNSADSVAVADNLLRQSPTAFTAASRAINPSPPLFNDPVPACNSSTVFNSKLRQDVDTPLAVNHQQPSFLTFVPPPAHMEMGKFPPNSLVHSMPLLPWSDHHHQISALFPFDNVTAAIRSTPLASSADKHSFLPDPSSASSITSNTFHLQLLTQEQEILQIFELYEEHLSRALQEHRERHTNALLASVDQCVCRCVREKEAEIAKLQTRNLELENLVKQMSFESQIWQNVARNNEAVATNLRNNLEQLVVQCREQIKEGSGESEAEDMESCVYRGSGEAEKDVQERQIAEQQRKCRFCRSNSVSVLFLPCKHLCVCEGCDPRYDECPLCGQPKSASVKVYLE